MRAAELAYKNGLATARGGRLEQPSPGQLRWPVLTRPPLAGFKVTTEVLPLQDIESAMSALQVAVASDDPLKVVDSVQTFHLCILEKPGNPLLLETGKRLIVPLLAFTRMRVQAKNLDVSPWVPEITNHQRILDALKIGDPRLAEQTVIYITSLFLKAALAVWAH
jgi:FCD domain